MTKENSIVKFKRRMNKICNPYYGDVLTDEMVKDLEEQVRSICLSFLEDKIFPRALWDLDNVVEVSHRVSKLCIRVPKWVYVWTVTGEFMSPSEVYEYLENQEPEVTLLKIWLL